MNSDVNKEFKRLKRLTSSEGKTDKYLEKKAEKNVFVRDLVNSGNFIGDEEKKLAKNYFNAYLDQNSFENYADLQTLGQLVYNEILANRIQRTINNQKNKNDEFYINDKLVKALHDTEKQIEDLKKILNLKPEVQKKDDLSRLDELERQFEIEWEFNKNEYTCLCANCGKLLLLRRKCKDFDVIKHPAFLGRWYCNIRMLDDVEKGLLTVEKCAYYQHTSPDWIKWCIKNKGVLIEIEGFSKKEIEEYIKSKPHLVGLVQKTNEA